MSMPDQVLRQLLLEGQVIPAHPLALNRERVLDESRQRALTRYYLAAGAGGLAVGVHTTQFGMHDPGRGLYRPVLELARETMKESAHGGRRESIAVAGVVGGTHQAVREAVMAKELEYDCVLISLSALRDASVDELIRHCETVSEVLPLFGFYLQPAVGGRHLGYAFWRRFAALKRAVAIKIAPFDRYRTMDVLRAVADEGRHDVALYTGNDDNILPDLLTTWNSPSGNYAITGGLLGQWAVWTSVAVRMLHEAKAVRDGAGDAEGLLSLGAKLTDANSAIFDARNGFAGCIAGIHEILHRQGLLEHLTLLDPDEGLSPGQREEIDRVCRSYPELQDDDFISSRIDEWLKP